MYVLFRLIKLVLLVGIIYILYKVLIKGESLSFFKGRQSPADSPPRPLVEMKKDPVCGTYLPEDQAIQYKNGDETHYFCSPECKEKYLTMHRD